MRHLVLFKTILKQEIVELRRYLFNAVTWILFNFLVFMGVFLGARTLVGGVPGFYGTLDAIIVGFFIWVFAMDAFHQFAGAILHEAQEGTLEQLYMTPVGFTWVCLFRVASTFLFFLAVHSVTLLLMMVTTGRWLHLDVISLLPLLLLTMAGAYGIGFITGGLALVFKRIGSFLNILQVALVGLVAAPIAHYPILRALPLAEGNRLIRRVMAEGLSIAELPAGDLLFLAINSAFYLGIGLIAFNLLLKAAKNRGLLGHY